MNDTALRCTHCQTVIYGEATTCPMCHSEELVKHEYLMTFRDLQLRHAKWLAHNFPDTHGEFDQIEIAELLIKEGGEGVTWDFVGARVGLIARLANEGKLHKQKFYSLLGAVEELGELAHVFIKMLRGIRESSDEEYDWKEEAADAVADCIIYLTSFCTTHDIDLQSVMEKTWNEVEQRDWQKYPKTGRPKESEIPDDD